MRLAGALDQLDPVAVGVADEADSRPFGSPTGAVRRLLRPDAVARQFVESPLQVLDRERNVVVARSEVVRVDPVVVGQLEDGVLAWQPHEDVDGLVADGHAPPLLEAEVLVELDGAVDVADSVARVQIGRHRHGKLAHPA